MKVWILFFFFFFWIKAFHPPTSLPKRLYLSVSLFNFFFNFSFFCKNCIPHLAYTSPTYLTYEKNMRARAEKKKNAA